MATRSIAARKVEPHAHVLALAAGLEEDAFCPPALGAGPTLVPGIGWIVRQVNVGEDAHACSGV
jgi:hypothetical protein